jgi:dihydropyrimidinase
MFDIVVTGGTVVLPTGVSDVDIGIKGEQIAAIANRGSLAALGARRIVDATNRIVIPGGIDTHVHCSWPLFVLGQKEPGFSAPAAVVSRAALYGGTTTLVDFCMWTPGETLQHALEKRLTEWKNQCHSDYAFHLMLQGELPPAILGELPEAIQDGHASLKIFTTDVTPSRRGRMVPLGSLWEVLKITAREGAIVSIHAEDNDLVMHMYEKLIREDRTAFENMAEVHSALSEDLSFRRVIRLAESIPGAAIFLMHVSAETGVAAVRKSRANGFPTYAETLQLYLLHTEADYKRPNGQIYHTYPSLKTARDQEALWAGTRDGSIHCIGTDEICCPLSVKTQGLRVDDTTGGNVSVEPRVSLMYTQMVTKRGYSLNDFVALTSTNAARVLGLYPRKGVLMTGSDADIVLLDVKPKTIRAADLHETDYSLWDGHEVSAWPSTTILRGKVVVDGGKFSGELTDGRFIPRKISDEVRSGSAL